MGIGSNWAVEVTEQEYQEKLFKLIITEAAILIVTKGYDRESAYKAAKELNLAQEDAISKSEYSTDEDSNITSFFDSSLEWSSVPKGKEAQIKAITEELREQFEGYL